MWELKETKKMKDVQKSNIRIYENMKNESCSTT